MANSTASIFIKPTVAFNRGDTFVFGSWVCTANGAGSFQRRLTMTPNPKTGLVTLLLTPKIGTGKRPDLWAEFGKEMPFGRKISSKDLVEILVVGNTPSFGRRTVCT
jgi:hypothetical protein